MRRRRRGRMDIDTTTIVITSTTTTRRHSKQPSGRVAHPSNLSIEGWESANLQ